MPAPMQRTLEEIKHQLQTLKPTLKKRFQVETIDIFGSYARNEASDKSDIDLLVTYSTTDYDHSTVFSLKNYLRRKLGVKVDVVSKEFLNPHIKEEVLKDAVSV
jgi:predicted nucleotidyltransferase